jgi:hypothetical protein
VILRLVFGGGVKLPINEAHTLTGCHPCLCFLSLFLSLGRSTIKGQLNARVIGPSLRNENALVTITNMEKEIAQ